MIGSMEVRYEFRYLSVVLVAFVLSLVFTALSRRWGLDWGLVAVPGGRRHHHGVVSRLGGVGLAAGFFGGLFLARLLPIPTLDANEGRRWWGLVAGGVWMFGLGLLDDRFDLPPWAQYVGYLGAGLIAVANLIILERFSNPFAPHPVVLPALLYVPLSLFWLTGMIVTVNWLDGLDGLAAGTTAIMTAVLAIHMVRVGQYSVVPQPLALLGAALGFLVFNVAPARVHMGSNGAFMLGYLLGALGLIAGARVATVLMVMGLPIIDVAWTIIERIRQGARPSQGDRRHLHYRLADAGLSPRTVVALYWAFCALFGALGLVLASRFYKLLALILIGLFTTLVLVYLSRDEEAGS